MSLIRTLQSKYREDAAACKSSLSEVPIPENTKGRQGVFILYMLKLDVLSSTHLLQPKKENGRGSQNQNDPATQTVTYKSLSKPFSANLCSGSQSCYSPPMVALILLQLRLNHQVFRPVESNSNLNLLDAIASSLDFSTHRLILVAPMATSRH